MKPGSRVALDLADWYGVVVDLDPSSAHAVVQWDGCNCRALKGPKVPRYTGCDGHPVAVRRLREVDQ